jgi:anti-anti-sigma factor
VLIINIRGRIDSLSARDAHDRILSIVRDDDMRVLLNLEKLAYLTSAGLRVILQTAKLLDEKRGELKVCKATGLVKDALDLVGAHSLIKMYDTEYDACSAFGP